MRKLYPLVLGLFGLSLAGCFSDSGDPGPDPETGSTGIEEVIGVTPGDIPTGFYASFDPLRLQMPNPNQTPLSSCRRARILRSALLPISSEMRFNSLAGCSACGSLIDCAPEVR